MLFQLNKASLLKVNVQLDKLIWKMIKQIDIKNLTAAAAVKTGTKMGKRSATLSFRQTKVCFATPNGYLNEIKCKENEHARDPL